MATVSKGKQGRVKKWVTDGRLRENRLKGKQARGKAAWDELLGDGASHRCIRPELVYTEQIDLFGTPTGIVDLRGGVAEGEDTFANHRVQRIDSFKKDRIGADGEKHVANIDRGWANSEKALWDTEEARRIGRLKQAQYLPPNPIDWRVPLPDNWRNRYHELSAKYPLLITLRASDTFHLRKICHFSHSMCQNVLLLPYKPLFAQWAAAKSAFLAARRRQSYNGFRPENAVFLCGSLKERSYTPLPESGIGTE